MNREDILRMAREAGLHVFGGDVIDALERFAALVAAMEAKKWEAKCQLYIDFYRAIEAKLKEENTC